MKYTTEMASGGMIYIPNFMMTGTGIQKLLGKGTDTHQSDLKSLILFFSE
jgi:hypothetical protein